MNYKKSLLTVILITAIVLSFLLSGSPEFTAFGQANWDDSKYSQYTWETFKNYGPANSEIDFKNIDYELLCAAIHYATNEQRVNFNLPPFGYSYYLKGAAMLHAYDMVKDNFFAHENPNDPAKKTPFDRMAIYYITTGYRAENIAYLSGLAFPPGCNSYIPPEGDLIFKNPSTYEPIPNHTYNSIAAAVLDNWMNSPGHRGNILNADLTYLGCGAAYYNDMENHGMPKFKCVQNFGSIVPQNP